MFMHAFVILLIELTILRTKQQNHVPFYRLIFMAIVLFFKGDSFINVFLPCFLLEYKTGPDRKGWNHLILVQGSWSLCKFHLQYPRFSIYCDFLTISCFLRSFKPAKKHSFSPWMFAIILMINSLTLTFEEHWAECWRSEPWRNSP